MARLDVAAQVVSQVKQPLPTGHADCLEIRLPESKRRAMRVAQAKFRRAVRVVGRYDEIEVGGHVRPRILLHYINRETSERTDLKTKGIPADGFQDHRRVPLARAV